MARLPWHGPLFPVPKHLVERYAAALQHARKLDCPLESFSIDRMGWSPQLAARLGDSYLGDNALRSAIILSPDQMNAPLLRRRFSYEAPLIEQVYLDARATLLSLIEYEPVIVEMDNGAAFCRTPSDVLHIQSVVAHVDTPRGTIEKSRDLLQLAHQLGERSRLLDDRYIDQMLALVKEVGDPRRRALPPDLQIRPGSLWAEVAGAVYILRTPRGTTLVIATKLDDPLRSAHVTALEIDDQSVVDVLHAEGFLQYVNLPELIRKRLDELELDALLSVGEEPAAEGPARRRQMARNPAIQSALPPLYWALDAEQKRLASGVAYDPSRLPAEGRWALSTPVRDADIVGNLLARFVRYDYRLLAHHHRRILDAGWKSYSPAKRRYLEVTFPYMTQGLINQPDSALADEAPATQATPPA